MDSLNSAFKGLLIIPLSVRRLRSAPYCPTALRPVASKQSFEEACSKIAGLAVYGRSHIELIALAGERTGISV
ncbi:MAG: hypothetical protein KME32_08180 [Mojavia pulchra JT2-VF2]|uniref:Uncharacterized protein n=1 Tax=Mojavia pulchra JT2-VF2 TaxID=287848 RepID=A0A951PY28_9NOST|nr:hypothetical protein [Mojavia pulchra JT2-VF2]